ARPRPVATALPSAFSSVAQVGATDTVVVGDLSGGSAQDQPAGFHDEGVVGHLERERGVLLDDEYADAVHGPDLLHDLENLLDDQRREADRRLVEQQEPRTGHDA